MAKRNDKGFITWLFTIITLVLSVGWLVGSWAIFGDALSNNAWSAGTIIALIVAILVVLAGIYLWWHGILILLGKESNTWLFVIVAFPATAMIGGFLMLIAKILN